MDFRLQETQEPLYDAVETLAACLEVARGMIATTTFDVSRMRAAIDSGHLLATELAARKFSYPRTDGSQWTLSLKDVNDRAADLEMAYNLNDCVELRWGAKDGSQEAATCRRHAPQGQRAKMTDYRSWFRERHWPTHTGA